MVAMPEQVINMIKQPNTNKAMACVSPDGKPHMIVCGSLSVTDPDTIVLGDVYMYRAGEYLIKNPDVEFIVWRGREGYSVKAKVDSRETEGPDFDKMGAMLGRMNMTVTAVWKFKAEEVWDESASDNAGKRMV